jgi:hypothetical protein
VECSPSSLQRLGIIILLSGSIVGMICLISAPPLSIRVVAWAGLVFCVLALPVGLQLVFRKTPTLSVNEQGVLDVRLGVGRIPWDAISSISVVMLSNRPMIQLWLRDENTYLARSTRLLRVFAPFARARGASPFSISPAFLTPGFKQVYEYMLRFAAAREGV